MASTCVLGLQWGDEAKGKLVDLLTDEHDVVVRFQGGANAGHTVVSGGTKYKFSLIPTGILNSRVTCVIGNGLVIDPLRLRDELKSLRDAGVEIGSNLLISDRAHVIFPYHKMEEEMTEAAAGSRAIGTTMRGIGPCYREKVGRTHAIRMGDLLDEAYFRTRLREVVAAKNQMFRAGPDAAQNLDHQKIADQYLELINPLQANIVNTARYLHEAVAEGKRILFEGAQGALLDVDHGTYPYVTSSNSSLGGLTSGCGVPAKHVNHFLGVVKAYNTRVGGGPFPTELTDEIGDRIREVGQEFGTVTGRPRRIGWFDAVMTRYSSKINGIDALAVMLLDVLSGLDEVRICVAYDYAGKTLHSPPSDIRALEQCEPVWETLPGWSEEITGARTPTDLPAAATQYVKRLAEILDIPVQFVSVGPDRQETIRFF